MDDFPIDKQHVTKNNSFLSKEISSIPPTKNHVASAALSIPDTGSTDILVRQSDSHVLINVRPHEGLRVKLPNNATMKSTAIGELQLPTMDVPAYVFPDTVLHQTLLSIPTLVNKGCTAVFTSTDVSLTNGGTLVAYGTKAPTDTLWSIDLASPTSSNITEFTPASANLVISMKTNADFVNFVHASFGSPVASSFLHATQRGYLSNYPRITPNMISSNLPNSIATAKGHLNQTRQGQHSTKPSASHIPTPIPSAVTPNNDDDTNIAFIKVISISETVHSDLTGRLPCISRKGNQYILFSVLNGYIHLEPMPSKDGAAYVKAFSNTFDFFKSKKINVSYQRLDNETSNLVEKFLKAKDIVVEYVPPNNHRANNAERAIQDGKCHIIATWCTTHPSFPLDLWDLTLPQIELTLNILRPFKPNPAQSAYEGIYGSKYDFMAHPIAPLGTLVVIHEKPAQRASWDPHGVKGFYIGPALDHYRCWCTWVIHTQKLRISDTLAWFPSPLVLPGSSPYEMVHAAIKDLTTALVNMSTHGNIITQHQMPFDVAATTATTALTDLLHMFQSPSLSTPQEQRVPITTSTVQRVSLEDPPTHVHNPVPLPPSSTPSNNLPAPLLPPPPLTPPGLPPPSKPSSPPPFVVIPPPPLLPSSPRDSRLRPHPTKKAYHARAMSSESQATQQAIDDANAEREFQQALSDDDLYRMGSSDMAVANAALNLTAAGAPLTRANVMSGPDAALWRTADSEEYSRLTDSQTFHPIYQNELPSDRVATYYNPQYKEKIDHNGKHERRCRGTIGGDRLDYPGAVTARTADMEVVKILMNSALSDDAEIMTLDIKDYYLGTPLDRAEYLRIDCKFIPIDCMIKYNLQKYVHNGFIMHEVNKGMYGLKQAGILAQQKLITHLVPAGYLQHPHVPCLFLHKERGTAFTLIVDDFFVKFKFQDDADHLITTLQNAGYIIKVDMTAKKYIGVTIERDRLAQTITLSMPGYIAKLLQRFQHRVLTQAKSPSIYIPPKYGSHVQFPAIDTSPPLSPAATTELQEIVGSVLYYSRAIDATMLPTVGALSSDQATPTQQLELQANRLLSYCKSYPDNKLVFKKSGMVQIIQSDFSYLTRSHARSVGGGISYLGYIDSTSDFINGNIYAFSKVIDVVVASVGEGEYASVFLNAQAGEYIRTILIALGHPQPPTTIYCDNKCAVGLANDTVKMKRSKSIDMRFHWIRDRVKQCHFTVIWIKGANNLADFFTKALPVRVHQSLMPKLVFTPLPSSSHFTMKRGSRYLSRNKALILP